MGREKFGREKEQFDRFEFQGVLSARFRGISIILLKVLGHFRQLSFETGHFW